MVVGQTNKNQLKKPKSHEPFPTVMEHEGKFVKTKQEIKHTITEYYKKLDEDNDPEAKNFNSMFPMEPENQSEAEIIIPNEEQVQHVQKENVDTAIQNQQKDKASGPNHTTAESFQHLPDHMVDKLKDIINAAIDLGVTPLTWQENFVKLIYKKNMKQQKSKTTDQYPY